MVQRNIKAEPVTACTTVNTRTPELVEIIDFKWLAIGAGLDVHVERMQTDHEYACACLRRGAASGIVALRGASQRLALALNVSLPAH